ncbi:lipopolysaccharide assembly protein LapA domain-containing protein [Dictyobacter aurantiacus]|uniref:Lipopolysaccharide assembly protein A domain-containing protein n=1 Tax=Dictyobacter aurantiacus TaxID=1936993 RepID=A0A401ZHN1_9CHLR|nr:lipopolysaccharide assembly protein LapA domain-containing protein [Dictyobacter aurantiacus]GCE06208.1 hypothetical protein KDAU_35370 [Dictyobacter aurantiacus]
MFYLILLLFLLVCGGLAVLTILNFTTQVHIVLFSWQSPDLPIGMWILLAFFLGALLLYLVSLVSAWSDRRKIKKLQRNVAELQEQLLAARRPVSMPGVHPTASTPDVVPGQAMPMPTSITPQDRLPSQESI